jgi:hypothetical protein
VHLGTQLVLTSLAAALPAGIGSGRVFHVEQGRVRQML